MKIRNLFIPVLLFVGLCLLTTKVSADAPPPPDPCPPDCPAIPIDGGISILAALGVGYGIKKVKGLQKL